MGFTWSAEPPGRGWATSRQRTLRNAKRHVATLIRQLNNWPGVLDLGAVADAIEFEPDAAAVWEGVLGYLAQSRFASLVTRIVDARYGSALGGREPAVIPIGLPAAAAAYLIIDTDPVRESVELGQRVRAGRLVRPPSEDDDATVRDGLGRPPRPGRVLIAARRSVVRALPPVASTSVGAATAARGLPGTSAQRVHPM
jgi:hypothetical protein